MKEDSVFNKDNTNQDATNQDATNQDSANQNTSAENRPDFPEKRITEIIPTVPYIDPSVDLYKNKKKKKKKWLIALICTIFGIYALGVIFSFIFFMPSTTINDIDVSLMTKSSAKKVLLEDAAKYSLDIKFINGDEKLALNDYNATVLFKDGYDSVKYEQNPFLWFVYIGGDKAYKAKYSVSYNKNDLAKKLMTYSYFDEANMEEPKDAYVDLIDGKAVIVNETKGSAINSDAAIKCICKAIDNYDALVDLVSGKCYEEADIKCDSDEITSAKSKADAYVGIKGQYDFGGFLVDITPENLCDMAYVNSQNEVVVVESKVKQFINEFVNEKSTYHKDRHFLNHNGQKIIISGGYYGWQLDGELMFDDLYNALLSGKDFVLEAPLSVSGYYYSEGDDIGDDYVEIDLTNQHVYVYKHGKMVYDSLCVSGCENRGMGTPGGVYPITYKKANAILHGPGYETPVSYWMPFNGGIGLHDATWQPYFGEDRYIYNGSHGCINLPLDAAGEIFDLVEQGMPVICYWEDEITYE